MHRQCARCKVEVEDFLWIGDDHPILTEGPMLLSRHANLKDNTITVRVEKVVKNQMCSDIFSLPQKSVMEFTEETPLEEAVFSALGAASACWENLSGAGIFESDRCKQIGEELMEFLKQKGYLDDRRSDSEAPTEMRGE